MKSKLIQNAPRRFGERLRIMGIKSVTLLSLDLTVLVHHSVYSVFFVLSCSPWTKKASECLENEIFADNVITEYIHARSKQRLIQKTKRYQTDTRQLLPCYVMLWLYIKQYFVFTLPSSNSW